MFIIEIYLEIYGWTPNQAMTGCSLRAIEETLTRESSFAVKPYIAYFKLETT